jgi:hypothetical protein
MLGAKMKLIHAPILAFASLSCGSGSDVAAIDGGPTIAITSPQNGAPLSIATSTAEPVSFEVAGFGLEAPGQCNAVNDVCGHVHVLVDDAACNAPGQNFNNAFPTAGSAASPATAIALLSNCASPGGAHAIRLELHRDDHSAVTNGASATVTITAGATGGGGPADAGTD